MEDFLFELAQTKYQMFYDLYKFNHSAHTIEECHSRIVKQSKYNQLLAVIQMLPVEQSKRLHEIENEYFSDVSY